MSTSSSSASTAPAIHDKRALATASQEPSTVSTQLPPPPKIPPFKVQSFDFTALVAAVSELQQQWVPSRVEESVQYSHSAVALRLRTMEHTLWLYLSWHPTLAHIGISSQGPPRGAVSEAFPFGEQLHGALKGLVLINATLPQPWERTLTLEFAVRPGDPPSMLLFVEIVGRYSNVVLVEARGKTVLAAGHQVGVKQSSVRAVYVGKQYALPPPRAQGLAPTDCPSLTAWKEAVQHTGDSKTSITNRCTRIFHGVSPALMRELCARAEVPVESDVLSMSEEQWKAVYAQWRDVWLTCVTESKQFSCEMMPGGDGYSVLGGGAGPLPLSTQSYSPILEFLRKYYLRYEATEEFEKIKHRLSKGVGAAVQRMGKKIMSLQQQAADPSVHAATSHLADLIMGNVHAIKPGSESVKVEDWETGKWITIPLDATKTAIECAEELYKKARKQRRAVNQVAPLQAEARAQLEYLQDAECMLGQLEGRDASDLEALREVEAELVAGGYIKPTSDASLAGKAAGKAKKAAKRGPGGRGCGSARSGDGYREYISPSGFTVFIGRNSTQNDQLTMKVAQPTDVWMHARGVPGAHVVLRIPPGQAASDEDMQFTADLAAYFSKSRMEGKLDVTVANPGDIAKMKGARPGQVLVKKEKVMIGRPGESVAAAGNDQ